MRVFIFRILLRACKRHTPAWIASLEIQILFHTTARAFGVQGKRVWQLSPQQALHAYAAFTVSCMRHNRADPRRLYRESYRTGRILRRITGIRSRYDVESLVFYLYSNIGITMEGNIPGEVTVHKCYFSRYYSSSQCALMSSFDAGIIAGLAGGGRLYFKKGITEGSDCCRAVLCRNCRKVMLQKMQKGLANDVQAEPGDSIGGGNRRGWGHDRK